MTRLLVAEDDSDIAAMLARGLGAEGFTVRLVAGAAEALTAAKEDLPEAVLLDIMLPDGSGFDICRRLREGGFAGPILFLSAKDEIQDRVEGLGQGADDYIVKPFSFDELVARLRTHLLRRQGAATPQAVLSAGRMKLDTTTRQVTFADARVRLTQREAELLALLMSRANQPISRGEIFDRLWAAHGGLSLNVVDVYLGYLRTKLGDITRIGGPIISTVRGRGFLLDLREPVYRA
ncbi:response regulator transcription factor [Enterovirga sp. CN4-39]|uniref:response regulator transcription factor n=1 Tax=Enterovirga sp. CN4-39 TaxID=3400910 RepID=UPI003C0D29A0